MSQLTPASSGPGGHPLWHLLIVALVALATFVGIKVREYWQLKKQTRANSMAADASRPFTPTREAVVLLGGCSAAASAIHASVCADHFREAVAFGMFFVVASVLQAAWALLAIQRPTRRLLIAGAVGNTGVILLWIVTRTAGLPFGPETWRPEAITTADAVATVAELVVVAGALLLALHPHGTRESCQTVAG